MPSSITHQLIAEEALPFLPQKMAEAVRSFPDEYYLGAQGPDPFFFYRIGSRSEYNLGKFLHRYRVYDFFSLLLRAVAGDPADASLPRFDETERAQALAYAAGYLTHYAADGNFHPFVYRYMKERKSENREHQQIENDWDVFFLRELRGKEAEKFRFAFSPKKIIRNGTTARLYACLARGLGRQEVTAHKFARGMKNFSLYLKFFHGKCYRRQRGWKRTERFFHAKRLLSRLYPRENPDPDYVSGEHFLPFSEGRGKNADELFALSVRESARLAELFESALERGAPLPADDFSNGLLTGKPTE